MPTAGMPATGLNYAVGLTRVRVPVFAVANALDALPRTFLYTGLGGSLIHSSPLLTILSIVLFLGLGMAGALAALAERRALRAAATRTATHSFGQGTFGSATPTGAQGLEVTFLIMLIALAIAGLVLLRARSSYPRDVATAIESDRLHNSGPSPSRPPAGQQCAAGAPSSPRSPARHERHHQQNGAQDRDREIEVKCSRSAPNATRQP